MFHIYLKLSFPAGLEYRANISTNETEGIILLWLGCMYGRLADTRGRTREAKRVTESRSQVLSCGSMNIEQFASSSFKKARGPEASSHSRGIIVFRHDRHVCMHCATLSGIRDTAATVRNQQGAGRHFEVYGFGAILIVNRRYADSPDTGLSCIVNADGIFTYMHTTRRWKIFIPHIRYVAIFCREKHRRDGCVRWRVHYCYTFNQLKKLT